MTSSAQAERVLLVEGQVTQLDEHHEMIASGWSQPNTLGYAP